jgi:uncharacterized SAM-binding protein YcdF (DUF218 family)
LLLTFSLVGMVLLSTHVFAWLFSLPLEMGYWTDSAIPSAPAEAIVVLSGSVAPPTPHQPYAFVSHDTYRRLQHGLWLHRTWKPLPILVCGGSFENAEPFAQAMRRVLEAEQVPPDLIWTETRSRSTRENALYGSEILRQHGVSKIALVVEASSMPRAAASFTKLGIEVVPAPVRFTTIDWEFTDVFPNWQAMALNGETAHEVLGLLWYRLRGWI